MSKPLESSKSTICPQCGAEMVEGFLHDALEIVHVESYKSFSSSGLRAWICPVCGHVELEAVEPKRLDQEDLSPEDLNPGAEHGGEA